MADRIADLIMEQGRALADAKRRSGEIWGGTVASLGQIPARMEQERRQRAEDALRQKLGESTLATQAQERTTGAQSAADVHAGRVAQLEEMRQKQASEWAEKLLLAKADPTAIAQEIDNSVGKLWTPQEATALKQKASTPEGATQLLTMLAPVRQPKPAEPFTLKDASGREIRFSGEGSPIASAPEVTPKMTPVQEAQIAETARHNKEVERISALTEGRTEAAQRETARHNREMEKAANPFGTTTSGTGATVAPPEGPHGEEYLKTLPANIQGEVKAYVEGRRPFPSGIALKAPYFQMLLQAVGQYDPSFDAANYNARNKARTDLTSPSGTGGKTINALNTAIQHAGRLSDLIETLNNYETPLANAVVNPLRTATGRTAVTNFNAVAPQLAKEIERAWRGAGGSTADIKELIDSIGKNMGRQQQREALSQFVELAKGKLDATQTQRDNVLGPTVGATIPVLFDQNKAVIEKVTQRAGGKAASGGIMVTGPTGQKQYGPFADQAAADRFVADAKAKGLWK